MSARASPSTAAPVSVDVDLAVAAAMSKPSVKESNRIGSKLEGTHDQSNLATNEFRFEVF